MGEAAHQFVAIDLGASSGRTVLVTLAGGRAAATELHRFPNGPVPVGESLYWDVERLFDGICLGLAEAAKRADQIAGIAVDAWGVDYALLDADGRVMDGPRHYRDPRTTGMMERACELLGKEALYAATGIQFMPLNTIYQLMAERSRRSVLDRADRLLFMPDFFNWRLCGVAQSEETIASTSQLYDAERHAWVRPVLERLDVPGHIMPTVGRPGTVLGPVHAALAEGCGFAAAPPVIATAGHDTAAAVAAVPAAGDASWAYISSGTWSLIGVERARSIRSPEALADNMTNEAGIAGRVRFLKNVAGLWLLQECRRTWTDAGGTLSYEDVLRSGGEAPALAALIDPDDAVFAAPGEMPARIAAWCRQSGQAPPDSIGAFVRCILDSLALTYRRVLRRLEAHIGQTIDVLHVVGGGSQNDLLNQITADAVGCPVAAGPVEAAALGNALVQAMAVDAVGSPEELRAIVARSIDLRWYEPQKVADWDEAEARLEMAVARRSA